MHLRIVGHEGELYAGEVDKVTVSTDGGRYTFLPKHETLVTPLSAGDVTFLPRHVATSSLDEFRDHRESLSITGGLCTVEDDRVTIVVE